MRPLSKHVYDIVGDNEIINNGIIGFTETQIIPSDFTCKISETLNSFHFNYNNNKNKSLKLTYGCRDNVNTLDKFCANGVCLSSFKKYAFADKVFTLMLVYRKGSMEEFFTNVTVETIYFSDVDTLRNVIKKNTIDFQTIQKNLMIF